MIDALAADPPAAPVAVLLTRAEEEGFIGAIGAVLQPTLLRKTDRVIAIECSAAQPYAPQGAGTIIRVGDRTSIFNSSLSYFLTQQAEGLAKSDKSFRYQGALMPGGTCEATVYDAWGYHAGSICVPLANYHNMDTAAKRIGPEYIDLGDWHSMVKLFVQIARDRCGVCAGAGGVEETRGSAVRETAAFARRKMSLAYAGSYPFPPHGWHRQMRLAAFTLPCQGPYLVMASMAYWLHVGVNRHWPPSSRPSVTR